MTIRTIRGFIDLAVDAVEAFAYAVFNFDRVADNLWSSSAATRSAAAGDPPGGSVPNQDVEPPGFQPGDATIAAACERIDILEQENAALQRENATLKRVLSN